MSKEHKRLKKENEALKGEKKENETLRRNEALEKKEGKALKKKNKVLEKENDVLKRKHETLNQNILQMAAERTENLKKIEEHKTMEAKLNSIIKQMQLQGRGTRKGMTVAVENDDANEDGDLD